MLSCIDTSYIKIGEHSLVPADLIGLFAFEDNISHIYLFEYPNIFREFYINSSGKQCISIGKYGHFGSDCFIIQCNDIRKPNSINNTYNKELYISYTVDRQGFFVSFRQYGRTLKERLSNFIEFASHHYNWGPKCKKYNLTLDEFEKMIISNRLFKY